MISRLIKKVERLIEIVNAYRTALEIAIAHIKDKEVLQKIADEVNKIEITKEDLT